VWDQGVSVLPLDYAPLLFDGKSKKAGVYGCVNEGGGSGSICFSQPVLATVVNI
jgi:hypothetical protein